MNRYEEFQKSYATIREDNKEKIKNFPKYTLYRDVDEYCQEIAKSIENMEFNSDTEKLIKSLSIITVREIYDIEPEYAKLISEFLGKARACK